MDRFLFFLLKPRAREPPCQGASGLPDSSSEFLRFLLFCVAVLASIFSLKIAFFEENCCQNGPNVTSFGSCLSKAVQKWKSVFGLRRRVRIAYEPILWSAQGAPKIEEKRDIFQNRFFYLKNTMCTYLKKTII